MGLFEVILVDNPYLPMQGFIEMIRYETQNVRTIRIRVNKEFMFKPGQFVQVLVPGVGEAPFCIVTKPSEKNYVEITVEKRGSVTSALHKLSGGSVIGVRGPLGKGFPVESFNGRDIVVIGTGIGIAALRALIWYLIENRKDFNDVHVLYGVRYPGDILYLYDIPIWEKFLTTLIVTCSRAPPEWRGFKGRVTNYFDKIDFNQETICAVCGSPRVMCAVVENLLKLGVKIENIYVSLERHMKCGIGKCARCLAKPGVYVCKDGPVFRVSDIGVEWLGEG